MNGSHVGRGIRRQVRDDVPLMLGPCLPDRLPVWPLLQFESRSQLVATLRIGNDRLAQAERDGLAERGADYWACKGVHLNPFSVWGDDWLRLISIPDSCANGHVRSEKNTRKDPAGHRVCLDCAAERRVRKAMAKAAAKAAAVAEREMEAA